MYQVFKDNGQSLPGEEEVLRTQKPNLKVYFYPFKGPSYLTLPKLGAPQLVLQPILPIETLKKYLASKFENLKPEDLELYCKNQVLPDHYKLNDVAKIHKFGDNKNIIHYMRKQAEVNNNSNNINNI